MEGKKERSRSAKSAPEMPSKKDILTPTNSISL